MGGLGPTEDDLTREAVAEALSLSLRRDAAQVSALAARTAALRLPMPTNNLKQADVLEGATLLPNPNGSAPGQWLDTTWEGYRKLLMLIPGPPSECLPLFDAECLPRLRELVPVRHIARRTLRAAMISESQADKLLAPIYSTYKDIETTILAHAGDIQLILLCSKSNQAIAQQRVDELATRMEEALEDWLYSSDGESLEQIVLYYLGLRQATLAVAESCTGGMIAQRITSVPGSSRSFLGGAVVYSNELKTFFAGVPSDLIAQHGAVSPEVAEALATGIRERTGATLGLGITGIAGPTGGADEKACRPGLHRPQRRPENRSCRKKIPGRPRPHPPVRHPASPRPRPQKAQVKLPHQLSSSAASDLDRITPCRQRLITRAVGAMVVSPALQRGVGQTNNSPGVP
jgi:nicotinamide-nucleotide amidase